MTVNPVGLLDRVKSGAMARQDCPAVGDALIAHEDVEIIPYRFGELRLRIHEIHDAQLWREPRDHCSNTARLTPRRSASGYKRARQPRKSAAAARIAVAVIRGSPEVPDSPLQSERSICVGASRLAFRRPEQRTQVKALRHLEGLCLCDTLCNNCRALETRREREHEHTRQPPPPAMFARSSHLRPFVSKQVPSFASRSGAHDFESRFPMRQIF